MNGQRKPVSGPSEWLWKILFGIMAPIGLLVLIWVNVQFTRAAAGGNDFLVHWIGMQAVLRGDSPYSDQTALAIQTAAYGRPALPGEHELRVAYPLYAELLYTPFSLIDNYSIARALWMTVLEIAAVGFALLAWGLAKKQGPLWQWGVFLVFGLLWYLGVRAIINGNAIVLVGLFIGLALYLLRTRRDWLVGIPLALGTIKPQVMLLPLICVLIWMLFQRRKTAVLSFAAAMVFLLSVSWLILPDWLAQNWREVLRYPGYNPPGTPAAVLGSMFGATGNLAGWLITIGVWIFLAGLWSGLRQSGEEGFGNVLCLTLLLAPLAGLQTDAGNEFILLLPLAWLLIDPAHRDESSSIRFVAIVGSLSIGLWWLFLTTLQRAAQPIQNPLMLFPLPCFLLAIYLLDRWRLRRTRR